MVNPCEFCDARCCKDYLVTVTSFDIARISRKTGLKPEEFSYLSPCRIINYDPRTVLLCRENGVEREYLLCIKSWPCHFLKGGKCTIHDFAPLACRLYPFNSKGEKLKSVRCPALPDFLFSFVEKPDVDDYNFWIKKYYDLVKSWNSKKGTTEECFSYLVEESEKILDEHDQDLLEDIPQ